MDRGVSFVVILKRFLLLSLLVLLVACLLVPSLREKKRSHWTRQTLLDLQRGLQSHLVEKEYYPMLNDASASDLAEFLLATGHLKTVPSRMWLTNMVYRSSGDFKNFSLLVYRPGQTNVWFSLDEESSL